MAYTKPLTVRNLEQLANLKATIKATLTAPALKLEDLGFPTLHPGQEAAWKLLESHRYVVLNWGRRAGKTEEVLRWLAEGAMKGEACGYAIPSNPLLEGEGGTLERARKRLGARASRIYGDSPVTMVFSGGGYIEFWTTHNGADRMRGRAYDRVACDEWALAMSGDRDWDEVIRPTLIDRQGRALFCSTPRRGGSFERLYRRAETDPEWAAMTIESWHNPALPESEVPRTLTEAQASGWSEQVWRREICADFEASPTDLVFPEFTEERHVRLLEDDWAGCAFRVAGVDPGGGDPNAIYKIGVQKAEGPYVRTVGDATHQEVFGRLVFRVYAEHYDATPMSMRDLSAVILPWHRAGRLAGIAIGEAKTSSEVKEMQQLWRGAGVAIVAQKGNPEARYGILGELLRADRLVLDTSCSHLIMEFLNLRRVWKVNPATGERYLSDDTDHQWTHGIDAVGYGVQAVIEGQRGTRGTRERKLGWHSAPGKREPDGPPSTWGDLVRKR